MRRREAAHDIGLVVRLLAISDLHLEMHADKGKAFIREVCQQQEAPDTAADVLVLAGDITHACHYENLKHVFEPLVKVYRNVVYVAGNHEFYRSSPRQVQHNLVRLRGEFPSVKVLDVEAVEIDGQRFVGGTMWFPDLNAPTAYKNCMNDFFQIKNFEPWVYERNRAFVQFLKETLRPADVVVTHHLPAKESTAPEFKYSALNCFFVSDCSALIAERQPRFWIHGHTHQRCNYRLGNTVVMANPLGYPSEAKSQRDFNLGLRVEV
jgi:Icc-related predicted phosphoesterase